MKKVYVRLSSILVFSLVFALQVFGQTDYNLTLVDNPSDGGCSSYNDVWGFEHSNGNEFAILGSTCGTVIYQLSSSGNATKVTTIPGATSAWRDIKNYGNFVYVVADKGGTHDGLLVIDMTNPSAGGISHSFYEPKIQDNGSPTDTLILDRAHNLYIDDEGFIYLAGAAGSIVGDGVGQQRINNGGILIFNAATNATNPPLVGKGEAVYAHDVFERNNMMVASEIYVGAFTVYELSKSPTSVTVTVSDQGSQTTGRLFTHNAWTNASNDVVLITDERSGAAIECYDISNPNQITKLDSYLPQDNTNGDEIPHNVHVMGDFAIASYYSEGVKVLNIKDPANVVEVAAYDTHTATSGFSGCWGAYPFLPSGYVLASDRSHGLFVLNPTYASASYLIGNVKDDSGALIDSAVIEILAFPFTRSDVTNVDGNYSMGVVSQPTTARAASNLVTVRASADGYEPQIVDVTLTPDGTVIQNFELLSVTLPIEISHFGGVAEGCDHKVTWQVGSLSGHSHFDLQVSTDGDDFQSVQTFFPSDQIAHLSYAAELNDQKSELHFYRLQQFDLDGTAEFSKIIQVAGDCHNGFSEFSLAPNPVQDVLEISSDLEFDQVEIYSTTGSLMHSAALSEKTTRYPFATDRLPSGIYFVRISTSAGGLVKSFIKR